ncbi:MAG: TrkA family potassium uptake protein [Clostridia bacterium]|nr:TrkA family potassium uptake protein [Clostridia bacterium]
MKKKTYAVIGLGKFGTSVALELAEAGADVLAIDSNEEMVREIAPFVTCAMRADVRDAAAVAELGLSNVDVAIIATSGSLDASVTAVIFAKDAGVPFVIAKAHDEIQMRILKKVGADRVLIPEQESGVRVARSVLSENYVDFIELSKNLRLIEFTIKPEWVGKSLAELDLRKKHRLNIIGIRIDDELKINFDPTMQLPDNCSVLLIADRHDLEKLL